MRRWAIPVGGALAVGLALTTAAVLPDVLAREVVAVRSAGAVVSSEGSAEHDDSDRQHRDGAPRDQHERLRAPRVPTEVTPLVYSEPDTELVATAYHLDAPIYARRDREPDVLGHLRRGRALAVTERTYGPGCEGGAWYRVGLGVICTKHGFSVGSAVVARAQRHVAASSVLPYRYASVVRGRGALRLHREPREHERASLERVRADATASKPEVVDLRMEGDYFVALDADPDAPLERWVRTVRGRVVHASDLVATPTSRLVGSRLEGELRLPLAFVYGEPRPLHRLGDATEASDAAVVGEAEVYARFSVRDQTRLGDARFVVDAEGRALRREHVRIARRIERPERVPEGVRWIHVDLSEQTLVAYESDRPIYATLVSTGREGYETPRGTFRVREKYVGTTMRGEDPVDGPYEVEEVPWTQYYWRSYAIHGAYWHDAFGEVRSHGCTNLAPADARFLFQWTSPRVPEGWHARRLRAGTRLHFSP